MGKTKQLFSGGGLVEILNELYFLPFATSWSYCIKPNHFEFRRQLGHMTSKPSLSPNNLRTNFRELKIERCQVGEG